MISILSNSPCHRPLKRAKIKSNWRRVACRLGSTQRGKFDVEINSVQAVINSSSKFKMKRLFEKKGVRSTKYYLDPKQITAKTPFPLVAKINYGSRGRGMVKLDNYEQFQAFMKRRYNSNYYFEEYFNGSKEYRVHYCRTNNIGAFYACRKMRKHGAEDRWYFNSDNCVWINEYESEKDRRGKIIRFRRTEQPAFDKPSTWKDILNHVKMALEAVGLDIGAVDVRVKKDGTFVILETNSAPGLLEVGTKMYLDTLTRIGQSVK